MRVRAAGLLLGGLVALSGCQALDDANTSIQDAGKSVWETAYKACQAGDYASPSAYAATVDWADRDTAKDGCKAGLG